MTVLEIKNQVIEILLKEEIFDMKKHLRKVSFVSDREDVSDLKEALVREALKDLEEMKFLRRVYSREGSGALEWWVMERPMDSLPQTIEISASLAATIAEIINSYLEANDLSKSEYADKTNVGVRDIENLVIILKNTLGERKK